jgi:hypothetical protein
VVKEGGDSMEVDEVVLHYNKLVSMTSCRASEKKYYVVYWYDQALSNNSGSYMTFTDYFDAYDKYMAQCQKAELQ